MLTSSFRSPSVVFTHIRRASTTSVPFSSHNGFVLQNRPHERALVDVFRPKNSDAEIRIEVADEQDAELCAHAATDTFVRQCPRFRHLGITLADALPYFRDGMDRILANGMSLLAFDQERLVGHAIAKLETRAEYSANFNHELHHEKPQIEFRQDYADLVEKEPWSEKVRFVSAVYHETVRQAGKFLPRDIELLQTGEVIGTHQTYTRSGLAVRMMQVNGQMCKTRKVDYDISYCVVRGSVGVMLKLGRKLLFEFPYEKFKVHGKPVYGQLADGATGIQVVGGYVR